MRQRSTVRTWEAFDDKAERLTSNVSIDGLDEADHRARLTRSPQGTICASISSESRDRLRVPCGLSFALCPIASAFGERPWGIGTGGCS